MLHNGRVGEAVKITIVVNNHAAEGLAAEHGFALWIETAEATILFDTGQGGALIRNADALKIDLGTADMLVLSHGHYDHSGGIASALQGNGKTRLYCHPAVVYPRYAVRHGETRSLQIPHAAMTAIDRLAWERIRWVQSAMHLTDFIGVTGPIPRESLFEDTGGPFFLDPAGSRPDPMADELALWIRTDQGLIVCVGCAHSGVINTCSHIRRLNGGMRIRALIGGFHLLNADQHRITETVKALQAFQIDHIVPCHCTGEHVMDILTEAFSQNCRLGRAGMALDF